MENLPPRLGVPAYAYPSPDSAFWTRLARAVPRVGLAIVNPGNGPGTAPDPNYVEANAKIRRRGGLVLGYVSTAYAERVRKDVLLDVGRWYDWYQIDGVFFDEVSTAEEHWDYYQAVSRLVRERVTPGWVVLNPGIQTSERYMQICDVLVNFEGTWAAYRDTYPENAGWFRDYSPMRFWHIVHTCPTTKAMRTALALAQARNAGWLFITTGSGSNPYDQLPGGRYWADELGWAATTVS